ncbi:hypothetical protein HYDPIDRAFT_28621 [Hydnomerulius pinastri MD-312]|uniref:Unplaced genomic scaffold scaffold_13, whole genome shotgun sequence n=1 Tax=Hydnomerulius pinastri MD-312 TaxID=994086 RepID=A0A0C9W955_9AGAM|nr:hypothetical protein HYDPIDRAFT_28621 [Hydnomerulius pinastri MD-312]
MSNESTESIDRTPKSLPTISGHAGIIRGIVFLPVGGKIVTCSDDRTIRVWNATTGEEEGAPMEHDDSVTCIAVTKDGRRIVSGGNDKKIKVWDVDTYQLLEDWEGEDWIQSVSISPNDEVLASGDRGIIVRELRDGEVKHSVQIEGWVESLSFSPDGEKLASGNDGGEIRIFEVATGDLVFGPIKGHEVTIRSVLWSPTSNGKYLFSVSFDKTIRKWDTETWETVGEPWQGHTSYIHSVALSPDGALIASTSSDTTLRFWNTDSGESVGEPVGHDLGQSPCAVAFSHTGEFIATGKSNGEVSVRRVPWWDDTRKQDVTSFLDLPAVITPAGLSSDHTGTRHPIDNFDSDQVFFNRQPVPHSRSHNPRTAADPSRTRSSVFSWTSWRAFPRLLFRRQHDSARRLDVTTIFPGYAPQRTYVASWGDEETTRTPPEPIPTTPGDYGGYSVILISASSSDSPEGDNQTTREVPEEHTSQFCCGLFARSTPRAVAAPPHAPPIELSERAVPPFNNLPPPAGTTSHKTTQDALDLPAVGPASDNTL